MIGKELREEIAKYESLQTCGPGDLPSLTAQGWVLVDVLTEHGWMKAEQEGYSDSNGIWRDRFVPMQGTLTSFLLGIPKDKAEKTFFEQRLEFEKQLSELTIKLKSTTEMKDYAESDRIAMERGCKRASEQWDAAAKSCRELREKLEGSAERINELEAEVGDLKGRLIEALRG